MSELIPFKNFHKDETVLLLGPGPTLNNFIDTFDKNIKRCCVNGVIIHPEFRENLDYYIWAGDIDIPQHPQPGFHYIMDAIPKLSEKTIKLVNCWTDNSITGIMNIQTQLHPEIAKNMGFIRYNQINRNKPYNNYYKDLSDIHSGPSAYSVAFHAIQILLYMGFKNIILVGFDCGGEHSYKKYSECKNDVCEWGNTLNQELINQWIKLKEWINKEYTDINIRVVNPIGLKEVFEEYKY